MLAVPKGTKTLSYIKNDTDIPSTVRKMGETTTCETTIW
jgi:hypothetical protein